MQPVTPQERQILGRVETGLAIVRCDVAGIEVLGACVANLVEQRLPVCQG